MMIIRLVLPAALLALGLALSQGVGPVRFMSQAAAESGGGGVGANERSVEILDYTAFRRRLARLSARDAREYAENLYLQSSAQESSSGIPVIEGFTAALSIRIFLMIQSDPAASERLLRQLDGVTDIEARRDILERAAADARDDAELKRTSLSRALADRTRDPEDVERIRTRSGRAAGFYSEVEIWSRYPERGIPRDRPEE